MSQAAQALALPAGWQAEALGALRVEGLAVPVVEAWAVRSAPDELVARGGSRAVWLACCCYLMALRASPGLRAEPDARCSPEDWGGLPALREWELRGAREQVYPVLLREQPASGLEQSAGLLDGSPWQAEVLVTRQAADWGGSPQASPLRFRAVSSARDEPRDAKLQGAPATADAAEQEQSDAPPKSEHARAAEPVAD